MPKVSTLLVDPDRLCREGLAKLLEDSPFEVKGHVSSIDEVIDVTDPSDAPELCLISYTTGSKEEVERVAKLRDAWRDSRIVILSNLKHAGLLAQSLEVGVDAFLLRDMSADALERALGLVMTGEKVMPTQLASLLINGRLNTDDMSTTTRRVQGLSQREIQILRCLVNGFPNKVIANQLDITEATVKVHLKGILKKINSANRTQAAIWAIKNGIAEDVLQPTGT